MLAAVFTPTMMPGGLDVTLASLERQDWDGEIAWIVGDDRQHLREDALELMTTIRVPSIYHFQSPPRVGDNARNLCSSYNMGVDIARDLKADLFVSLQDYIWVPENGLRRFAEFLTERPTSLVSGITHIANVPPASKVVDPEGAFTVFAEPYTDRPESLEWVDCRLFSNGMRMSGPVEWEANWSAVPRAIFEELKWDEEYDRGVAYENQDYAMRATHFGADVWVDQENVAISLPHKAYFKSIDEFMGARIQKEWHERRWGL